MEKKIKEIEKEEEIDVRKIYLTNFKPHKQRVGKEYQAIIQECISLPKPTHAKYSNSFIVDSAKKSFLIIFC